MRTLKHTAILLLFSLFFCFHSYAAIDFDNPKQKPFVVVVPSYNNKEWYKRNLDSIFMQKYDNYRVIYVDDASPDETGKLVKDYCKELKQEERTVVIQNDRHCGSLANLYKAIGGCDPREIVVDLDGDDWFHNDTVLAHLNHIYSDEDVWATYGQFVYHPCGTPGWAAQVPKEVIEKNGFRDYSWVTTALRTFYAGLFHKIDKEELLYQGDFFQMAGDLAFMFPIVEMAGTHSRFVPEVLYVYNVSTNINDIVKDPTTQRELGFVIRGRKRYQPLQRKEEFLTKKQTASEQKKIAYISPGYVGDLFAIDNPVYSRDNCLEPFCKLKEKAEKSGIELRQTYNLKDVGDFDYLIVFEVPVDDLDALRKYPKEKLILVLWEPPSVLPENYKVEHHQLFNKVLTWHDDFVDNKKYFKLYHPVLHPMIADVVPFKNKKLCNLIACNKNSSHPSQLYEERVRLIHFFEKEHPDDFDLYGRHWPNTLKTYKGNVDKKVECQKQYRFSFAYENIRGIPGYVTEKMFDAFRAGSVPVYLGALNVTQYVPKECFIDRNDFESDEALYLFLKQMDEETYDRYLGNIRRFLSSTEAQRFSSDYFVTMMLQMIQTL